MARLRTAAAVLSALAVVSACTSVAQPRTVKDLVAELNDALAAADETNRLYERAQDQLVALSPDTPQTFATGSDHYLQFSQPDLVVAATELVERRAAIRS